MSDILIVDDERDIRELRVSEHVSPVSTIPVVRRTVSPRITTLAALE